MQPRLWRHATGLACRVGLLCAALLASWGAGAAEDAASLEQRVKAAFLYQFASYVEWPALSFVQPDTPVTIAVMGAEQLAAELKQLSAGRTVGGRKVGTPTAPTSWPRIDAAKAVATTPPARPCSMPVPIVV